MGLNDSWSTAGNAQNGGTVLPVANLIADSKSGTLLSYSRLIITQALYCVVLEIFTCDTRTEVKSISCYKDADKYMHNIFMDRE